MRSKFLLLSTVILLFTSCTQTYIVTFSGSTGGTVSDVGGEFDEGTVISVTAQPDTGYDFQRWSDGSTQNPRTITVSESLDISAIFTKKQFQFVLLTEGEGEVRSSGNTSQNNFEFGSTARFEALPSEGWEFDRWTGDVNSDENPLNIVVDKNINLTAIFKRQFFPLTISLPEETLYEIELIDGEFNPENPNQFTYGSIIRITFKDDLGWVYKNVSGDFESSDRAIVLTIESSTELTANYINAYFVTAKFNLFFYKKTPQERLRKEKSFSFEYFEKLFVRKYPLKIVDLSTGEIVWSEYTTGLYDTGQGTSIFENSGKFILPPGRYRIFQPDYDPDGMFDGINNWMGGYSLPVVIDQEFTIQALEEKDQSVELNAYIPNFTLLTFDTTSFDVEDGLTGIALYTTDANGEQKGYAGLGSVPFDSPTGETERIYFNYIGLDYYKENNLNLQLLLSKYERDANNRILSTRLFDYELKNQLKPNGHIHFDVKRDTYDFPYIESESEREDLLISPVSNNSEILDFGFLTINGFDYINSENFFPAGVIGESSSAEWDYESLLPNNYRLRIYGPNNYTQIIDGIKTNSGQIDLNFVPISQSNNTYRVFFEPLDSSNDFSFSIYKPTYLSDRVANIDFSGSYNNSDMLLFSIPDANYDKIEIYRLWQVDLDVLDSLDEMFGDNSFKTEDNLLALKYHKEMVRNNESFYRFFKVYPTNVGGAQAQFGGLYFKAYRDDVIIREKRFSSSEYELKPNTHYNYSLE